MSGSTQAKARAGRTGSLNKLTATELTRAIATGATTCEAVVRDCLERIDAREDDIHAWANIDPEMALRRASAQPETVAAVEDAAAKLSKAGAQIRTITLPDEFSGLRHAARETINNYERAAAMAHEWTANRGLISGRLRKRIELGRAMPHADYIAAVRLGESCRARLPVIFEHVDVLLAPCVNGEAPRGLEETGDPGFQAIWTILHAPAVSMPTHRGPNRLPVGIQLVAQRHDERRLFACAHWIWQRLGTREMVGYGG
jgi:Asp-tRNA(Asn)/Glu-tRNA(Gln) amidotransferase A subunit family amidase